MCSSLLVFLWQRRLLNDPLLTLVSDFRAKFGNRQVLSPKLRSQVPQYCEQALAQGANLVAGQSAGVALESKPYQKAVVFRGNSSASKTVHRAEAAKFLHRHTGD